MRRLLTLTLGAALVAPYAAPAAESRRHAERPAAQAGMSSSHSYLQRSMVFSAAPNSVEFDYFVDSEPNDELRVLVDGNLAWSASGLNRSGHAGVAVPAGFHTVRFEYVKDGAGDGGLDTARVDDIKVVSKAANGVVAHHHFEGGESLAQLGWSSGGAGAWEVAPAGPDHSAGSPLAQRGQANTVSFMEKTVSIGLIQVGQLWQARIELDYFVDSEEEGDFLNLLVDGQLRRRFSGRQAGRVVIPLRFGSHTLRVEYAKNASGDRGRDLARIDNVLFVAADGRVLEHHRFEGRERQNLPISVPGGPAEWTSGGAFGGWTVHKATPPVSYVPVQTAGEKWRGLARWRLFSEPVVDGRVGVSSEYRNPTVVRLEDQGAPERMGGEMVLVAADRSGDPALFIGLRARGTNLAQGLEQGSLRLFVDRDRSDSLIGVSDCGSAHLPRAEDHRLLVGYEIPAGEIQGSITLLREHEGDCAGGWKEATARWIPTVAGRLAVSEPADDPGWIHLELRLPLPSDLTTESSIGLGFLHRGPGPTASRQGFPDAPGDGPTPADVLSWATVDFAFPGNKAGLELSERRPAFLHVPLPERARMSRIR